MRKKPSSGYVSSSTNGLHATIIVGEGEPCLDVDGVILARVRVGHCDVTEIHITDGEGAMVEIKLRWDFLRIVGDEVCVKVEDLCSEQGGVGNICRGAVT